MTLNFPSFDEVIEFVRVLRKTIGSTQLLTITKNANTPFWTVTLN